ncbi:MAG: hypothetical protein M3333_04930 [Actinomycetota bacterium]|nr:hypothetical protein [Actinomycetota bacterium]
MNTTIKATCPACGEVALTSEDIVLRIGPATSINSYGFSCPRCSEFVTKTADERVVRLLLSGGVRPIPIHVPAEVLEYRSGPPINHDDILALHELLDGDDWFEELSGHRSAADPPSSNPV